MSLAPFSKRKLAEIKSGKVKLNGRSTFKIDVEAIKARQSKMSKEVADALFGKPTPKKREGKEAITYPMAEKMLDAAFSTWKRMQAADADGMVTCFLCGKPVKWQRSVLMHFQSRTCLPLQWDETANQVGCRECNSKPNGDREHFAERLDGTYGQGTAAHLYIKSKGNEKYSVNDLLVRARWYRERIQHITDQRSGKVAKAIEDSDNDAAQLLLT